MKSLELLEKEYDFLKKECDNLLSKKHRLYSDIQDLRLQKRLNNLEEIKAGSLSATDIFVRRKEIYREKLKGYKAIELFNIGCCLKVKDGILNVCYDEFFLVKDSTVIDEMINTIITCSDFRK